MEKSLVTFKDINCVNLRFTKFSFCGTEFLIYPKKKFVIFCPINRVLTKPRGLRVTKV